MASIALGRTDVIVGIDTHKHQHVAVAIDGLGGRLGELYVASNSEGYAELLGWARSLGVIHGFGVEATASYGIGLARFLRRQAQRVIEVSRPPRAGERRLDGKATRSTPRTLPARSWPVAPFALRSSPTAPSRRSD